ncbi:flagellar protein FlaG [bacterium]|nr:flagellar protein FlaG [bacterium]
MDISTTPMNPSPSIQKVEIPQKQKSPEFVKVENDALDEIPKEVSHKRVDEKEKTDKQITKEQAKEITDNLNKMVRLVSGRIQFKVHNATGQIIIQVIDTQTNEVIREIPPEKALNAEAKIRDVLHILGILMDEKV